LYFCGSSHLIHSITGFTNNLFGLDCIKPRAQTKSPVAITKAIVGAIKELVLSANTCLVRAAVTSRIVVSNRSTANCILCWFIYPFISQEQNSQNSCSRSISKHGCKSHYEGGKKYCRRCDVYLYHNGVFCLTPQSDSTKAIHSNSGIYYKQVVNDNIC
jgi:hypothetical protein